MSVVLHFIAVICALFIVAVIVIVIVKITRAFGAHIPRLGPAAFLSVLGWIQRYLGRMTIILLLILCWMFFPKGCSDELSDEKPDAISTAVENGREIHAIPPIAEDGADGTIVGGQKTVMTNVAPDQINDWMLRSMTGPDEGWNRMRREWTGSIDKHGYLPLPIGPLLQGAMVETRLGGSSLPATPAWWITRQDQEPFQVCGDENRIGTNEVALFLEVRSTSGYSRHPNFGRTVGVNGLECTATVTKLPNDSVLWVGSYSTCMPNSLQVPGVVPFRVDGEEVSWTMRITFIPSEPVAPGAWELKETITVPGFYDTQQPRLWLMPENVTLDNSNPEALKAGMDAVSVFRKELRPLFPARESPTRDSFTVTSAEVRRFWEGNPDEQVERAVVYFQPPTPALVYWEVFFPVADAESK